MHAPIFVAEDVMDRASVSDKEAEGEGEDVATAPPMNELERLELDMQKAINDERYEDAARLRDEIKELKKSRDDE